MTHLEWVIKVLSENAKEELPKVYKLWLFDNLTQKNIRINVKECVCNELEWTDQYVMQGLFFVQEERMTFSRDFIDNSKTALVLIPMFYEVNVPYYLVYWYDPNIEISKSKSKAEMLGHKIRRLNLPTFEEWKSKNNEVTVELGAYRVEIRPFCWGAGCTKYGFAMSLANCNALNVYTERMFSSIFEHNGDVSKLKQWYDSTVSTFHDFWDEYISKLYLESNE